MSKRIQTFDISEEITKILDEYKTETLEKREAALNKASEYMVQKLEAATPVDTGKTKRSWQIKDKYKGVRYIHNTRVNQSGVPVVNLLEYGAKGNPFVRKTFETEKGKIIKIIKGELQNGDK